MRLFEILIIIMASIKKKAIFKIPLKIILINIIKYKEILLINFLSTIADH